MAITMPRHHVQQNVAADPHTITLATPADAGSFCLLFIATKTSTALVQGVTGFGATWTMRSRGWTASNQTHSEIWTAKSVSGGNDLVIDLNTSLACSFVLVELAGEHATPYHAKIAEADGTSSSDGTTTQPHDMGDITTTEDGCWIFHMANLNTNLSLSLSALTSPYVLLEGLAGSATVQDIIVVYYPDAPAGTYQPTITSNRDVVNGFAGVAIAPASFTPPALPPASAAGPVWVG